MLIFTQTLPVRCGFFNNIPAGPAILLDKPSRDEAYSMVSSNWLDWKTFTLHQAAEDRTPSLRFASGEAVRCHGYITGTWTEDGNLSQQWSGLQFFVVDCDFGDAGSSERRHFLINRTMLSDRNLHHSESFFDSIVRPCMLTAGSDGTGKEVFLRDSQHASLPVCALIVLNHGEYVEVYPEKEGPR